MPSPGPESPVLWRARVASLALDAGLLAYVAWCAGFVGQRLGLLEAPLLAGRPLLALVALPLACLWQVSDGSLGQRLYGLARRDASGAPAGLEPRARAGALTLLEMALVGAPLALKGFRPAGPWVSLLAAAALLSLPLADPLQRSLAERLSGLRTVVLTPSREQVPAWWRRVNGWVVAVALALTLLVGAQVTRLDLAALGDGAGRAGHLVALLADPDWGIAGAVVERMVETVYLGLMASVLALPFGLALGFVAARNVTGSTWGGSATLVAVRLLLNVTRSIEPILWAIIFVLWVGVGPFAGTLALCVHSIASLAKLYSEALEGVDPGPVEAVRSTGASALPVLRYGMLPQVTPALLSFTVYRWDINVRMATILGFVGGGGIGAMLVDYMQLSAWRKVGTIVVAVTLVVWAMDVLSSRARKRLG